MKNKVPNLDELLMSMKQKEKCKECNKECEKDNRVRIIIESIACPLADNKKIVIEDVEQFSLITMNKDNVIGEKSQGNTMFMMQASAIMQAETTTRIQEAKLKASISGNPFLAMLADAIGEKR